MDEDSDARRIFMALELEQLALVKATEEINKESRRAEQQAVRDCAARGLLQSGIFGGRIADGHRDRAKRIVDKQIELRRSTLQVAPEVGSEENFRKLLESASATIDGILRSIPEHLKRRGFQIAVDTVGQKDDVEAFALKAHARREIEMLKREHGLRVIQKGKEARLVSTSERLVVRSSFEYSRVHSKPFSLRRLVLSIVTGIVISGACRTCCESSNSYPFEEAHHKMEHVRA